MKSKTKSTKTCTVKSIPAPSPKDYDRVARENSKALESQFTPRVSMFEDAKGVLICEGDIVENIQKRGGVLGRVAFGSFYFTDDPAEIGTEGWVIKFDAHNLTFELSKWANKVEVVGKISDPDAGIRLANAAVKQ
jgi:hypothetical protein